MPAFSAIIILEFTQIPYDIIVMLGEIDNLTVLVLHRTILVFRHRLDRRPNLCFRGKRVKIGRYRNSGVVKDILLLFDQTPSITVSTYRGRVIRGATLRRHVPVYTNIKGDLLIARNVAGSPLRIKLLVAFDLDLGSRKKHLSAP